MGVRQSVKWPNMIARTHAEAARALEQVRDRRQPGRTLDLLARMLGFTDTELHHRTGGAISRQTINQKRTGASPVRAADLVPLAEAVGVDVGVLLLPPSAAARWVCEHRADHLDSPRRTRHRCVASLA